MEIRLNLRYYRHGFFYFYVRENRRSAYKYTIIKNGTEIPVNSLCICLGREEEFFNLHIKDNKAILSASPTGPLKLAISSNQCIQGSDAPQSDTCIKIVKDGEKTAYINLS